VELFKKAVVLLLIAFAKEALQKSEDPKVSSVALFITRLNE